MGKIKIGTQMEEGLFRQLELAAVRERRPVGELLQEAVAGCLLRRRGSGLKRLVAREPVLKAGDDQLREILESDFLLCGRSS